MKAESVLQVVRGFSLSRGCWAWPKYKSEKGYGIVNFNGKNRKAHRVVFELLVKNIRQGMTIDHLCRNRACINPNHLEEVSMAVNVLRGTGPSAIHARQTSCVNGHDFTKSNTRVDSRGQRVCRTCSRDRYRQNRESVLEKKRVYYVKNRVKILARYAHA